MEDLAEIGLAGPPEASRSGDQRVDERPCLVGPITFVATAVSGIILVSGPVLWHGVSSMSCDRDLGIPYVGTTHDLWIRLLEIAYNAAPSDRLDDLSQS